MLFKDLILKRCSVRDYSARPIEQAKLDYILDTARLAPSACNNQPWYFIVIRSEEAKSNIQTCYHREWFKTAPLYILVCIDHQQSWKRNFDNKDHADIDAAIATEHICLAAAEQEIGTCWVCHFDAKRCSELFDLPDHIEPVVIIPMGYPANPNVFEQTIKQRKQTLEIVFDDHF